jgi:hypothetical protein
MRWLILVTVLGAPAFAETWEWKLVTGGGRPDQVLFVLTGNAPPPRRVIETWQLKVDAPDAVGHSTAHLTQADGKERTTTDFELWNEQGTWLFVPKNDAKVKPAPVVQREPLPHALSTERVTCRSQLLGGITGQCTAVPDGPLAAPLYPLTLVVDPGEGHSVMKELVLPLLTGGLLMPGTANTSVIAYLTPRAPKLPPELERWKKGKKRAADLPETLDAETAGAMLVLAGAPRSELVTALGLKLSTATERWPLIRLARERGLTSRDTLLVISAVSSEGGLISTEQPLLDSALSNLEPLTLTAVNELVAGRAATLRAHLVKPERAAFERETLERLEGGPLATGEAGGLVMSLSRAARRKHMTRLLDALPTPDGLSLLQTELREASPSDLEAVFIKSPRWIDRLAREKQLGAALNLLTADDARARVLNASLTRLPEADRGPALVAAFTAFNFDTERFKVLERWKGALVSQPSSDAVAMVNASPFSEARARVFAVWHSILPADERVKVLQTVLDNATFDDERLKDIALPIEALSAKQAVALLKPFDGDSGRATATCRLVSLVPPAEQPMVLAEALTLFPFASGRLEALRCTGEAAKRLDAAQKKALLENFNASDRTEVERLIK